MCEMQPIGQVRGEKLKERMCVTFFDFCCERKK